MATLEQVCGQVQDYLKTLPNVRNAPALPLDGAPSGLFVLTYPDGGTWEQSPAGMKRGLHRVKVELYLARKDASKDLKILYPFFESVPNLLFAKLNATYWEGLVETIGAIEFQGPRVTKFNDVEHWLVSFTVTNVKMKSAIA